MEVYDELRIMNPAGEERYIQLLVGDITELPPNHAVDLLVVSAFQGDYAPTPGSVIGQLARRGVSVAALADDKAFDFRNPTSCWLSREIAGSSFKRILCFEPTSPQTARTAVGDIFRALVPFVEGPESIRDVAIPLVATGDQGVQVDEIVPAILHAATKWMSIGSALRTLKIVIRRQDVATVVKEHMSQMEGTSKTGIASHHDYDLFISYSWENKDAADAIVECLSEIKPQAKIFLDRLELRPGMVWQRHIFEAIDRSRRFLAIYSPAYRTSKVCLDEFNIAWMRRWEMGEDFLVPLYWRTAPLPTYMTAPIYRDCREESVDRLREAVRDLF